MRTPYDEIADWYARLSVRTPGGGKVGATHWPLPEPLHAFGDSGVELDRFAGGDTPVPTVLAIRARKPA